MTLGSFGGAIELISKFMLRHRKELGSRFCIVQRRPCNLRTSTNADIYITICAANLNNLYHISVR